MKNNASHCNTLYKTPLLGVSATTTGSPFVVEWGIIATNTTSICYNPRVVPVRLSLTATVVTVTDILSIYVQVIQRPRSNTIQASVFVPTLPQRDFMNLGASTTPIRLMVSYNFLGHIHYQNGYMYFLANRRVQVKEWATLGLATPTYFGADHPTWKNNSIRWSRRFLVASKVVFTS